MQAGEGLPGEAAELVEEDAGEVDAEEEGGDEEGCDEGGMGVIDGADGVEEVGVHHVGIGMDEIDGECGCAEPIDNAAMEAKAGEGDGECHRGHENKRGSIGGEDGYAAAYSHAIAGEHDREEYRDGGGERGGKGYRERRREADTHWQAGQAGITPKR